MTFNKIWRTLRLEPSIIFEALDKNTVAVHLPPDYWRYELAMYVLCKSHKSQLPSMLRGHFCPLFWFTNLLLLTAIVWLPIYGLLSLLGYISNPVVHFAGKMVDALDRIKLTRTKASAAKQEGIRLKMRYDAAWPEYLRLRHGHEYWDSTILFFNCLNGENLSSSEAIDSKSFFLNVTDDLAYYVLFLRKYRDAAPEKLEELGNRHRQQLQEEEAERIRAAMRGAEANAARKARFSKLVASAKPICKWFLILASIPVTYFLAKLICFLAVWCWVKLLWLIPFVFVEHGWEVLKALGIIALIVGVVVGLIIGFGSARWAQFKDYTLPDFVNKTIVNPVGGFFDGFRTVFRKIGKFFAFCFYLARMFFLEHCPAIQQDEETK